MRAGWTRFGSRSRVLLRHPAVWLAGILLGGGIIVLHQVRPSIRIRLGEPLETIIERLTPALTEHVILISVDGLRPDAIERFDAGTLQKLAREGRYTFTARTVLPPKTLPAHTSMLTGTTPRVHGVTWNTFLPERNGPAVPTIFELARERGLRTAAFFSKTKFEQLAIPEAFDFLRRPQGGRLGLRADQVEDAVEQFLERHKPNLLFVHIGDPDYAGHAAGWMSGLYGRAVRSADDAIADIMESANESFGRGNYTVIVTADHGGSGKDHGMDRPEDVLIPWIVWGRGVSGLGVIDEPVETMDTAASILWLLGIPVPAHAVGTPVRSAFTTIAPLSRHFTGHQNQLARILRAERAAVVIGVDLLDPETAGRE